MSIARPALSCNYLCRRAMVTMVFWKSCCTSMARMWMWRMRKVARHWTWLPTRDSSEMITTIITLRVWSWRAWHVCRRVCGGYASDRLD